MTQLQAQFLQFSSIPFRKFVLIRIGDTHNEQTESGNSRGSVIEFFDDHSGIVATKAE